ncbi:spermidine synthase-like protein [Streptomyces sp. AJS327]|uniref:spermidine synthase n=1 Tax=Streptomyces sp. AJS327 TaxID=2545265 RepID=UPI0015DEACB5|nr:fused MFS/spermidine synthase [Streptomyces sp. AJS327]MBA0051136.1 spermidine synthase-like protein [Streptomyces sp. AJS327]
MDQPTPVSRAVDGGTARLLPDLDRPDAWLLTLDGAPQSYVDLADPRHLEFEYLRRIAHLLDTAAGPGEPLDVLHLGGGACTLPRYLAATRPGSRQRVAEADGALSALVAERLPLPPEADVRVETADARAVLEAAPAESADALVVDVYGATRVPAHLTTLGFAHAAARALRPGGVYVANLADSAPFGFLGTQIAAARAVFGEELCLLAEPAVLRGRRFGNIVLAASRRPLPVEALARRAAADPFPARVVRGAGLARLHAPADPPPDGAGVPSPEPPEGAFSVG